MEGNIAIKVEFGCSAEECLFKDGRNQSISGTEWEVIVCGVCKSSGTHKRCSYLPFIINKWECNTCRLIFVKEESIDVPDIDNKQWLIPLVTFEEHKHPIDLPLPAKSNEPKESQDLTEDREYRQRIAASKTLKPGKAAPKSSAERVRTYRLRKAAQYALNSDELKSTMAAKKREYRQRIAASRTLDQEIAARRSESEKRRLLRLRKAAKLAQLNGSLESTSRPEADSRTLYNGEQSDEPKDLPTSNYVLTGAQEYNESGMPSAPPPIFAVPKTMAQKKREYRKRIAASRTLEEEVAARKLDSERRRFCRLRKAANLALLSGSLESPASLLGADSRTPYNDTMDDAASATPFVEKTTIAATKSMAQKKREYRLRIAASRTLGEAKAARKSNAERVRVYRLRKAAQFVLDSNALTEVQDTTTSIPATTSVATPKIADPKWIAHKKREYRQRIAVSRTLKPGKAAPKSSAERVRIYRLRKAAQCALDSGLLESTATASRSGASLNDNQTGSEQQATHMEEENAPVTVRPETTFDLFKVQQAQSTWCTKWAASIMRFKSTFLDNDFGYACSVCDRLWFKNDLKPITPTQLEVISEWFSKEKRQLCREEYDMVCNTCKRTLNKKSMPLLAKVNGFSYPDPPPGLPPLDIISERLISPRLPFKQVRRLRHDGSKGIVGQVINVPVDVQEMVNCLPRQLNEDGVINVNINRNIAHKSVYISRYMAKNTISAWLSVLQKSPLYLLYKINVDLSRLRPTDPFLDGQQEHPSNTIESISAENTPETEILASREHTMMWNEEDCLNIARGRQATPLNIITDRHAEELSFPSIYFGEPRRFSKGFPVTPYLIVSSEIRRRDRRGAMPQKILYVAMNILRLRMVAGIYSMFRNVSITESVTRRMLDDTEFMNNPVIQNLAFMNTVPNSLQYWVSRKRDLLAMIRQFGKPTIFLTINVNETRWFKLLTILLKLSKKYPGKMAKDLNTSERCTLVSDDPVTCCIYFHKLVGALMKMLKSKQYYNPFGKYFVNDYFLRIEFQHRRSTRAHIFLWLNDDPHEAMSENMPRTIDLMEKICSVARDDVPNDSSYANQIHKHTVTCTTSGELSCSYGIPYWPMTTTRVLVPLHQFDDRRQTLEQKAQELRASLDQRRYTCMDDFLNANGLTYISYLDIVRSTLSRPTLMFRRNCDQLMTNTFNPYLASEINSHIDIQFILDEHSCAELVVEYLNKPARGMGNLCRDLSTMMQEPYQDYTGQLKALSIELLNTVEMSAQEAAWYLLRQPMSETSRQIVYIPTVWPTERQCCRKLRQQMGRERIDGDSTDFWTKNIIQRYEERPASLEQVYLAEFASWYANSNDFVDEEDNVYVDGDEDSEAVREARTSRAPKEYRRRPLGRVIRYKRYDINETINYIREMVLLYVQFRNEMSEIIDGDNYLQLFESNRDTIMERHSLFETNLNIENVIKELEASNSLRSDDEINLPKEESKLEVDDDEPNRSTTRNPPNYEETEQCDDKTAILRVCMNQQSRTTGDHS